RRRYVSNRKSPCAIRNPTVQFRTAVNRYQVALTYNFSARHSVDDLFVYRNAGPCRIGRMPDGRVAEARGSTACLRNHPYSEIFQFSCCNARSNALGSSVYNLVDELARFPHTVDLGPSFDQAHLWDSNRSIAATTCPNTVSGSGVASMVTSSPL